MENINSTVEVIMNRCSIRSYKSEQISEKEMDTILKCGIQAPVGRGNQSWEIVLVQNKDFINDLNKEAIEYIKTNIPMYKEMVSRPNANIFFEAPSLVIVAEDPQDQYSRINCCLAMENMIIAAASMKIGSCMNGFAPMFLSSPEGQKFLDRLPLSEGFMPYISTVFGYTDVEFKSKPRYTDKIKKYV